MAAELGCPGTIPTVAQASEPLKVRSAGVGDGDAPGQVWFYCCSPELLFQPLVSFWVSAVVWSGSGSE